jgi:hypothetical protein
MIKLEHVVLASPEQMEFIIEGMRNPMNSWEKSDSEYLGCEIDETDLAEWFKRLRELFGSLSKVVEPGKPIKVTDYRCHRDFYVRAEYTYIPIFRRNMPYHRRNF